MSDENKIKDAADAVKGILEAVPIYGDAIQPAAKEVGKALQTVAKTINVALLPFFALVLGIEGIMSWLVPSLAQKLRDVPEDRIVTPSPTVAGPALEALRFAGHNETLRELYANLLATSMDAKTAKHAHPAFVEIIRQLSPDEARIMKGFAGTLSFPMIHIRSTLKENQYVYNDALRNFSLLPYELQCETPELASSYVDNLCRLGLARTPDRIQFPDVTAYRSLEQHPVVLDSVSRVMAGGRVPVAERVTLQSTDIGRQFIQACVIEHSKESDSKPVDETEGIETDVREDLIKRSVVYFLERLVGHQSGTNARSVPFLYPGVIPGEYARVLWSLAEDGVIFFDQDVTCDTIGPDTGFTYLGRN